MTHAVLDLVCSSFSNLLQPQKNWHFILREILESYHNQDRYQVRVKSGTMVQKSKSQSEESTAARIRNNDIIRGRPRLPDVRHIQFDNDGTDTVDMACPVLSCRIELSRAQRVSRSRGYVDLYWWNYLVDGQPPGLHDTAKAPLACGSVIVERGRDVR